MQKLKNFISEKTVLSLITLIIFSLIFFFPLIFQQKMYSVQDWGRGDLTHFNYPLHAIYGDAIKHFEIPFITNKIYGGFELFAEGQTGVFYLPNIILFFLFSNYTAYALSFFIVGILSSIGVYVFCRQKKLNHLSSIFGSITFAFSMFLTCHFVHLNMVEAFSLVPWFFVSIEYELRKPFTKLNHVFFVFLVTEVIFVGHPQIALYTISATILYVLLESSKEMRVKHVVFIVLGCFLGSMIAFPQLFATWELSKTSPSSSIESAQNSIELFPYTMRDFLYFLLPFPFGNPSQNTYTILQKDGIFWENNTYSGIIAFVFFLFAFFKVRTKIRNFFLIFLVFLIFSMGWLYFFYYVPPFSLFRLPQRSLIILIFSYSVIAAYGFSSFFNLFKKSKKALNILSVSFLGAQFLTLTLLGNYYNSPQPKSAFLDAPRSAQFLMNKEGRVYAIGGVKLWEKVYKNLSHGWSSQSGSRILATKNILDPNRNAVFNISSLDGYAKLVPLRTLAYLSLIRKGVIENDSNISVSSSSARLLGMASVKYIITAKKINSEGLKEVFSYFDPTTKSPYYIYENTYYTPLVKLARELRLLPKTRAVNALDLIGNTPDTFFSEKQSGMFENNVKIKNLRVFNQHITLETDSNRTSFLVISESYNKNWTAIINNKNTPIIPININSLGIKIPNGKNTIELQYIPHEFLNGLKVGFVGVILLVVTVLGLSSACVKKILSL